MATTTTTGGSNGSRRAPYTRRVLTGFASAVVLVSLAVVGTAPVSVAASTVFSTMNDSGGLYWRSSTSYSTPIAKSGYGVYPGTRITVHCYQIGTANVPGSKDAMWVQASWYSGPGRGSGWINEHFVNDGAPINKAASGVPACSSKPAPPKPAPSPSGSVMNRSSSLTLCPGITSLCSKVEASVSSGTSVHMVCWQNPSSDPHHRYFYIQASGGREGFVHAESVSRQTTTPGCSSVSWTNAANWALGQDGKTKVPSNAKYGNKVTYWSSWCWLFSFDAWRLGAGHTPRYSAYTAKQTYNLYKAHGLMKSATASPPRGSLVFFNWHSQGHVAVSLGSGWVETTRGSVESKQLAVTHEAISKLGLTQLGYVPPGNV